MRLRSGIAIDNGGIELLRGVTIGDGDIKLILRQSITTRKQISRQSIRIRSGVTICNGGIEQSSSVTIDDGSIEKMWRSRGVTIGDSDIK